MAPPPIICVTQKPNPLKGEKKLELDCNIIPHGDCWAMYVGDYAVFASDDKYSPIFKLKIKAIK